MKRTILFGGLILWGLGASAYARNWGFDKDTVYEWRHGGDTVRLTNHGTETLRLDSLYADGMGGGNWHNASFLYREGNGVSIDQHTPAVRLRIDSIPPGNFLMLSQFGVANILTKLSANTSTSSDTLRIQLRFKSIFGDEDTLVVMGFCCGTSIMPDKDRATTSNSNVNYFDILGRTLNPKSQLPTRISVQRDNIGE